jgi:hypothetical protein
VTDAGDPAFVAVVTRATGNGPKEVQRLAFALMIANRAVDSFHLLVSDLPGAAQAEDITLPILRVSILVALGRP